MSANGQVDEQAAVLPAALAAYFGREVEEVTAYVVICELNGQTASSAWAGLPHWGLLGLVDELRSHIERLRTRAELDQALRDGGEP